MNDYRISKKDQERPEWLKIGAIVHVQSWTAIVRDVARTDAGYLMVLVESPKNVWLNQRPEWLEFMPEYIKPAKETELERDIERYQSRIDDNISRFDSLRDEMRGEIIK